jgi:hypothetical protein
MRAWNVRWTRLRLSPALLRGALFRPEPLLALLVFMASALFFASGLDGRRSAAPSVEIAQPERRPVEVREVRLVRYDSDGLEIPAFARVSLPEAAAARMRAVLAALREAMLGEEWPEGLPMPTVFVESVGREVVAVLDFRPEARLSLSVEGEARLLRSIRETLLVNGADQIRFLLNGEAAGVFLEHLAVPAAL